jgi:hypothetical protein
MNLFKQSTAASRIVGPALDSTGAEYASLVIGDLSISKNGGTLTAMAAAATLTYIANGYYTLALITGNTDTVGTVQISCNKATYQMPPHIGTVLVAAAFDVIVTNGTIASVSNITGGTITTTTNLTNLPTIPANWITAAGLATDAGTEIAAAVATNLGTGSGFTTLATQASVNTIDDFIDTEVTAIKAVTDKLDTALVLDVSVYQFTANALELAPTGGSAPTAAAIADAVWDEAISGHLTAGTTGLALNSAGSAGDPWSTTIPASYAVGTAGRIIGDNLNATVTSRMASYTQPTGFLAATFPATVSSLDAAGTRTALGMASANMDTQITGINTSVTNMQQATILNNTARSNFPFEMVLLDGTAATGITVTGARSLDGAAYAAVSGTIAEVGSGTYSFSAAAADTNGGGIMWKFSGTGCKDTLVGFVTSI